MRQKKSRRSQQMARGLGSNLVLKSKKPDEAKRQEKKKSINPDQSVSEYSQGGEREPVDGIGTYNTDENFDSVESLEDEGVQHQSKPRWSNKKEKFEKLRQKRESKPAEKGP